VGLMAMRMGVSINDASNTYREGLSIGSMGIIVGFTLGVVTFRI
jgi:hypothetical protein